MTNVKEMTSRERVLAALRHEEADRVPVDLGGGLATGFLVGAYRRLKKTLGIDREDRVLSRVFQLAHVDTELLGALGVDVAPVYGKAPSRSGYVEGPDDTFVDEWGVTYRRPPGGLYYDIVKHPLAEATLDDLDAYPWPDPLDPGRVAGVAREARDLREGTDYAVAGSPSGVTSIFELSWYLRGFQQLMIDFYADPEFASALLGKVMELQKAKFRLFLEEAGGYIDVVRLGDDIAMQTGPIMSPGLYRRFLKPRQKEYFAYVKERTGARLFYHTCGNVTPLIGDLVEIGVDVLNPVQVSATGMDTARLKLEWGERLTFWGAIDTQRVLPYGSPEDVREEVRRRIADLAPGGGYVVAAVHTIQPDVPPENIVAMCDEVKKSGRYPIRAVPEP